MDDDLDRRIERKREEYKRTTNPRNRFSLQKQLDRLLAKKEELKTEPEAASS